MDTSELRAGFYRIAHDVKNPTPDKRKVRDWTAAPLWQKGKIFYAAARHDAGERKNLVLELVGAAYRYAHSIAPYDEKAYAALVEAFEPVAEDYDGLMHRLDMRADTLLDALHRMHRVSLADLAEANAFVLREYDVDEHDHGQHKERVRETCPKCIAEGITDNQPRGI